MTKSIKISVITPSHNSAEYLEEAVKSVLIQDYPEVEHIIVDGGSNDGTLQILKKYSHLKWISEKDKGQSDAMNKGFRMATGDIIVYLNADDYFLPGAFHTIIPYFRNGHKFVVGNVKVLKEDGSEWTNNPKVSFHEMLKHWERNAFCVNPVGYFYLREVQENVPAFNEQNSFAMDLEFLLHCALKYKLTKISEPSPLGVFRMHCGAKTFEMSVRDLPMYSLENFSFIDQFLIGQSPEFVLKYQKARMKGYKSRVLLQRTGHEDFNSLIKHEIYIFTFKLNDFIRSKQKSRIILQLLNKLFKKHHE